MKNKEKAIVTSGFTPANNELRIKIIKDCGLTAYAVYLSILSHRNTTNDSCFPTIQLLAEECCCSVDTIKRQLKILEGKGYLIHQQGNSRYANQYYFPMESFYKGQGKQQSQQEQPKEQQKEQQPLKNNNEYVINEKQGEIEKMNKYIPSKAEDEALEELRRQEAIERKQQPKQEQHKPQLIALQQEPQQPYKAITNEYINAFAFIDEEVAEYSMQQEQQQPKPQSRQKQEFDVDAWANQPYQFTGKKGA